MVAVWLDDNDETTLKYFYQEGKRVRLQPANPTMDPIYIDPSGKSAHYGQGGDGHPADPGRGCISGHYLSKSKPSARFSRGRRFFFIGAEVSLKKHPSEWRDVMLMREAIMQVR